MIENLYELKKDLIKQGVFFSFNGPISQDLMIELSGILRKRMQLEDVSMRTILRVFSMVVEQTQNIIHYSADKLSQETPTGKRNLSRGIITVGIEDKYYFVLTGNLIKNKDIARLSKRLTQLQKMDQQELKVFYREQRKKEPEKTSKGAGLGFIEMAKKSTKKFEFSFQKVNEEHSFFSLKTII
ncbi:MAG: hypothetical protein COB67_05440 [SAR324 cluster bacterium]|uniref:Histidine kinase n=1 Tax=SAR324 cluster bacterium TaxID=2024889 RepID=A0A2A4T5F1_9DELT|nr:MAG: hypothetical protein COB67_05440 [SAR324 cluster bacterium]